MLAILAAAMMATQAGAGAPPRTFIMPPKAKPAEGSIGMETMPFKIPWRNDGKLPPSGRKPGRTYASALETEILT